LQCVAVCCSVLQCVAVCCSVLQCFAVCCSVMQCGAVWCNVLQGVAVCCSALQCVAMSGSEGQCDAVFAGKNDLVPNIWLLKKSALWLFYMVNWATMLLLAEISRQTDFWELVGSAGSFRLRMCAYNCWLLGVLFVAGRFSQMSTWNSLKSLWHCDAWVLTLLIIKNNTGAFECTHNVLAICW